MDGALSLLGTPVAPSPPHPKLSWSPDAWALAHLNRGSGGSMQLIRGTLTGSTLIAALAIGGLAQADDDHPPAPPKPYHAEHAGEHQASPHGSVSRERTMEMQRSLAARNLYQGKV